MTGPKFFAEALAEYEDGVAVLLQTFPIKLVYTVRDDALLVVAVFHVRRRPGCWLERLKRGGR